jgi:hypothetical protein
MLERSKTGNLPFGGLADALHLILRDGPSALLRMRKGLRARVLILRCEAVAEPRRRGRGSLATKASVEGDAIFQRVRCC